MKNNIEIKYIDITKLKEWENNPRINDEAAEKLTKLISNYGFINPVIITADMKVRAGHTRLKAAKKIGMDKVPAIIVNFASEAEAEAFSLADNKSGEWADWDFKKLASILLDLDTGSFDMDITGFALDEIEDLINEYGEQEVKEEEDFDIDEELEAAANPISHPGDIWILNEHRVVCGDATKSDVVKNLMGDNTAQLIFTDPPYNVDYEGSTGMKIQNDNMADTEFRKFLLNSFKNMFDAVDAGSAFYICHADSEGENFRAAVREAGWNQTQTIIWVKNALVMGRQDYQWKHEPILYGWKPGAAHKWYGFRDKTTVIDDDIDITKLKKPEIQDMLMKILNELNTTVIREDKPRKNDLHPTMKPLPLIRHFISNSSRRKDIILDLFLGSGSTMIAAEQLERVCYGAEIDPVYTDVIVNRYIKFRGDTNGVRLLRDGDEIHYNDIKREVE
jgi:DNA modification methylase